MRCRGLSVYLPVASTRLPFSLGLVEQTLGHKHNSHGVVRISLDSFLAVHPLRGATPCLHGDDPRFRSALPWKPVSAIFCAPPPLHPFCRCHVMSYVLGCWNHHIATLFSSHIIEPTMGFHALRCFLCLLFVVCMTFISSLRASCHFPPGAAASAGVDAEVDGQRCCHHRHLDLLTVA